MSTERGSPAVHKYKNLREQFERIARRAAEAGYPDAGRLFAMTPVEIEWELAAFAARERTAMERLDTAAWLTGRYCAVGWHAPKRYPRRPDGVRRAPSVMSDEDMKAVFQRLASEERGGTK